MQKKLILTTATVLLVCLLFFLRFHKLYEFATFLSDQGRDAIILKRIITFEHFPAIGAPSSVGQVYLGPFYYYLVAPFLALFNFNPVGPAVGVAILSIISILVAYLVVKKEISPFIGIVFLSLMTFSAVLTEYSRFSWNPNLLPYFSFFTLYFFSRWLKKPTIIFSIVFGSLLGFSIQLHYLGALLVVPLIIVLILEIYSSRAYMKYLIPLFIALVTFAVAISPLIIFDLRHDFLNSHLFIKLFSEGGLTSGSSYYQRLIETISGLVRYSLQLNINSFAQIMLFVGVFVAGIFVFKKNHSRLVLINLVNMLCYVVVFAVLGGAKLPHYYGPVILSFYLIFSSVILLFKKIYLKIFVSSIIIIAFIYLNLPKMYFLSGQGNNQIQHARNVAQFLGEKIDNKPFNFATWPVDFGEDEYLYFLELKNMRPADRSNIEITDQMFVICGQDPCLITDSPSWNISMFGPSKVQDYWKFGNLKIYKLVHI